MLDNQLWAIIITIIKAGLTSAGTPFSTLPVLQAEQPTQEGVPEGPAIFLTKLPDHRYGSVGRNDKWDEPNTKMVHTEKQQYESTFQVNALAIQDPANVNSLTAADIVNRVAAILQSDYAIVEFRKSDIGIQRIIEIRNPYFIDDKGRNEASPSFDFILSHKQVIISESPVVVTEEYNFNRV